MYSCKKPMPLVWINGYAGVGKLTVSLAMARLREGIVVIDNHQLIDPVEAQFPRTHPEYQEQRRIYRQHVLNTRVQDEAKLDKILVFTDVRSTEKPDCDVPLEYEAAAAAAGRPFVPVHLSCDRAANLARVGSKDRVESGTRKLTDVDLAEELLSEEMSRFKGDISVDSTTTSPDDVARQILDFVDSRHASAFLKEGKPS